MSIQLGSNATIIKPGTIKIVSTYNPETIIQGVLAAYLKDTGYSEMYPNFDSVNIGSVHPFALLLFQEIQGDTYDMSVFPSITISDNSLSEESDVLSDARSDIIIEGLHVGGFKTMVAEGKLFISDSSMTALEAATANGGTITAVKRVITRNHGINFSIWSANREVTSLLFELTMGCLIDQKSVIKNSGLQLREISGSRTGDINMDFGAIIYGASISVPGITSQTVVTADSDLGIVSGITVAVDPDSDPGQMATTTGEVSIT